MSCGGEVGCSDEEVASGVRKYAVVEGKCVIVARK